MLAHPRRPLPLPLAAAINLPCAVSQTCWRSSLLHVLREYQALERSTQVLVSLRIRTVHTNMIMERDDDNEMKPYQRSNGGVYRNFGLENIQISQ